MQAIKIEPGCKPELTEIPNTLRAFQQAAGGHIEAHTITRSDLPALVVILNEEGRLQGLPANGRLYMGQLYGHTLVGPVVIVRAVRTGGEAPQKARAEAWGKAQKCNSPKCAGRIRHLAGCPGAGAGRSGGVRLRLGGRAL